MNEELCHIYFWLNLLPFSQLTEKKITFTHINITIQQWPKWQCPTPVAVFSLHSLDELDCIGPINYLEEMQFLIDGFDIICNNN